MLARVRFITTAFAACLAVLPAVRASAAAFSVAVVREPDADPTCQEIATRIVAELMSDGFVVASLICDARDGACPVRAGAPGAAVVEVRVRDNVHVVDIRAAGVLRSVADQPSGGGAASLAVRTADVLRALSAEPAAP